MATSWCIVHCFFAVLLCTRCIKGIAPFKWSDSTFTHRGHIVHCTVHIVVVIKHIVHCTRFIAEVIWKHIVHKTQKSVLCTGTVLSLPTWPDCDASVVKTQILVQLINGNCLLLSMPEHAGQFEKHSAKTRWDICRIVECTKYRALREIQCTEIQNPGDACEVFV